MFFQIIESSSSGNSSFLECDGVRILIDAGVGITKIKKFLNSRNLKLDDLDGVFITHDHSDHVGSLKSFENSGVKIYANRPTAEGVQYKLPKTKNLNWNLFETGCQFDFYGIDVLTFSIPHDTSDPVGFSFCHNNTRLVYITDIGKPTHSIRDIVSSADILVLESNYCPVMLQRSTRPQYLKDRIMGSWGHLSNADAIDILHHCNSNVKRIYLSHISRECNNIDHINNLLLSSDLDATLLEKVEIVSPFSTLSSCFEIL